MPTATTTQLEWSDGEQKREVGALLCVRETEKKALCERTRKANAKLYSRFSMGESDRAMGPTPPLKTHVAWNLVVVIRS